ncbi:sulfate adenylyltransferase [Thermaerobacter marianensis DSM 12885]|uniref:Multifunctional fusion protein n=1 Tax=Thermaerobacter marianensis (strain ATCC 700841 / DSM 12885 / JCM 10246 / 7p75a) TaxID=644966 RepID=E6SH78_THEM7|nr:adenylyl-sulfate kinase [Thermaerobacter marianensis]ADU51742.1 sulfate adenylyltransferase [Thermaerobacter marianensis DSM 12885]
MPQRGVTVWFTGLPGAGKSTLAREVAARLRQRGLPVEVLDGDVLRQGLCRDLGFSPDDRRRQVERAAWVAGTLTRHGIITLVAVIAPYRDSREQARREIGDFLEVYVRAPLEVLVARDPKGLYRKALAGQIQGFTGVDAPYEEPERPDLVCDTSRETVAESTARVLQLLEERGYLPPALPATAPARPEDGPGHVQVRGPEPAGAGSSPVAALPVPGPIPPHGGTLVWRTLTGEDREAALEHAARLPRVPLDEQAAADLELIATGAFSPLTGFMGRADYEAVVDAMRLASGVVWPLPVTLAVSRRRAARLRQGDDVALVDGAGRPVGLMQVTDIFSYDKEREAEAVFGTTDAAHPGVARLFRRGEILLGGPVWFLGWPGRPLPVGPAPADPVQAGPGKDPFAPYRLTPWQTRRLIDQRGWRTVVGFQTRNPVHRAHEYLQKVALEMVDGLLLHPLVGPTKADDVPAPVRLRCYLELLRHYYPAQRVLFAVFPAAMRYAGPREALFHALCRKNYGCTHFIVGRDHAGVGHYYGAYDAQRIFDRFAPEELAVTPLKFEQAFYCRRCSGMATTKTCPHGEDDRVILSGTRVRAMLAEGQLPPPEFSRPEVARILVEAARSRAASPGA